MLLCFGANLYEKGKIPKKIYLERKKYQFENIQVWGIKNYDYQLTKMYGDYLKLPPVEEQKASHNYSLFINKEIKEKIDSVLYKI